MPFRKKPALNFEVLFHPQHWNNSLQLQQHTAAVSPAGLINVLDYQLSLACEERLKGHGFCFTFVIAFESAWSHCRLLLSWKTGTRCTNRCTCQYSWFIGYGSQMYTAKISTWYYQKKKEEKKLRCVNIHSINQFASIAIIDTSVVWSWLRQRIKFYLMDVRVGFILTGSYPSLHMVFTQFTVINLSQNLTYIFSMTKDPQAWKWHCEAGHLLRAQCYHLTLPSLKSHG